MALMPTARYRPASFTPRRMGRYDIVCIHTIVGHDPAGAAHFSTGGDGTLTQSRDTAFQSAANLNGNYRIIAIENEDFGPPFPAWGGSDVPELTDAQIDRCAEVLAWAHLTHGVPLQLCPNSRPGSQGLAYHRQGIDGNFGSFRFPGRVPGGEVWTLTPGKACPGDRRIAQLPLILDRARDLVNQENDMQLSDPLYPNRDDSPTVGTALRRIIRFADNERDRSHRILAELDSIETDLDHLITTGGTSLDQIKHRIGAVRGDVQVLTDAVLTDEPLTDPDS